MKSRCVYCGSVDYGKGCRYGPHGVHFHPNNSTKCAYCGSTDYGKGCKLNPTTNLHVHGIAYNSMIKDSIQSFLDNEVLLKELKKDYTDFVAFERGIIDNSGNKIKEPITEEEKACFGPFVKTIIRLKKYLGAKIELMEASTKLTECSVQHGDLVKYKKLLEYQERITSNVNDLYQTLDEARQDGLSFEDINKLIRA